MKNIKRWMVGPFFALLLASCQSIKPTSSSTSSEDLDSEEATSEASSSENSSSSSSSSSICTDAFVLSIDGADPAKESRSFFMLINKDTESVSLSDKVHVSEGCVWSLFRADTEIRTKVAAGPDGVLASGDNTFHILVTNEAAKTENTYKLTIHRSYIAKIYYHFERKIIYSEDAPTGYEHTLPTEVDIKGYVFQEWQDKDKKTIKTVTPWSESLDFYAVATVKNYSIPLELAGGELDSNVFEITFNAKYELPTPVRKGYKFEGWWAVTKDGTADFAMPNKGTWDFDNIARIEARWEIIAYRITYSLGAGAVNDPSNPSSYTIESDIALADPYLEYYDFLGWYLDDEKVNSINGDWTRDIVLVAKWDWHLFTVRYLNDDGSLLYETGVRHGEYAVYYGLAPKSAALETPEEGYGYPLLAWTDESGNDYELRPIPISSYDLVLTAKYGEATKIKRTIQYIDENGNDIGIYYQFEGQDVPIPMRYIGLRMRDLWVFDVTYVYEDQVLADCVFKVSFDLIKGVELVDLGAGSGVGQLALTKEFSEEEFNVPVYCCSAFIRYIVSINKTIKTLYIPHTLQNATYGFNNVERIVLPKGFTDINGGSGINDQAFSCCSSLKDIVLPDTITSIGKSAFSFCSSLKEIAIPSGVTSIGEFAFYGCSSLKEIAIPSGVTSIGEYAFSNCSSLKEITIPNGITSIANCTFDGCESLERIVIPESVTSIGNHAFSGCVSLKEIAIPESVISIGSVVFAGCSSLTEITIPNSVSSFGYYNFDNCNNLKALTVPCACLSKRWGHGVPDSAEMVSITASGNNTAIPEEAFYDCGKSFAISIQDGITTIGARAFGYWKNLTEIDIPASVIYIGSRAFEGCSSIESIALPEDVTSISEYTFAACSSLKEITIPKGITKIEAAAFFLCKSLERVVIPESVTSIGGSAFSNCTSLKEIVIPESVKTIESRAFEDCTSLEKIVLPANVTLQSPGTIFEKCESLASVYYKGSNYESWCSALESAAPRAKIYLYSEEKPSSQGNYWHYIEGVPTPWDD